MKPQTTPVRDHQCRIVDLGELGSPLAIERVIERMGENVTEVVCTVRRQLRLRKVGGSRYTFAGVDVLTVGIRIAVLVAQDAAVPPAFEKSACVDAVLPSAVAIKVICA